MTIYILRHGETDFNRLGIVQGSGVDTDLNLTGRRQASAFYNFYHHHQFDLVVTSALKRTHQTVADFISQGTPWIQTPDINEICWGDHEGKTSTPERIALYEKMIHAWQNEQFDAALPNGESATALNERLQRFISFLKTRPADKLLVCTHGRTIRALVTLMKGHSLAKMEDIKHSNTGCFVVHLRGNEFEFEVENSTVHLAPTPHSTCA